MFVSFAHFCKICLCKILSERHNLRLYASVYSYHCHHKLEKTESCFECSTFGSVTDDTMQKIFRETWAGQGCYEIMVVLFITYTLVLFLQPKIMHITEKPTKFTVLVFLPLWQYHQYRAMLVVLRRVVTGDSWSSVRIIYATPLRSGKCNLCYVQLSAGHPHYLVLKYIL